MKYAKYFGISLAIIALDQLVKMLVYFNMDYGLMGQIQVFGNWFKLHYTLNPGMAFGLEIGSEYGKLILTLGRLIVMTGLVFVMAKLIREGKSHTGFLYCLSLILGGAVGNVIDSTFYGIWLNNAPDGVPTPWFHGQVIDMFYVDIWEGMVPEWIPFLGGQYYSLWPIFNIADASIFCAILALALFQNKLFKPLEPSKPEENILA
jgi:signal peptidase II